MGCWNKTCGLSNLHIYAGDPVYVFLLEQNPHHDRCYSTAFWAPVMLPFLSEYDDYGGGENSSPAINYILEGLKEQLVEMPLGKNEYHDIAVNKDILDEKLMFEAVHEGRLKIHDRAFGGERLVDFVMFRKDIVDHITETLVCDMYVGEGKGTGGWGNNYIYYKFADVVAKVPEFIDKVEKELLSTDGPEGSLPPELRLKYAMRGLAGMYDFKERNLVATYLGGLDDYRFSRILRPSDAVVRLLADGKREEAEAMLIDILRASFINSFMESTRKSWMPGGHEGSQASESKGYRVLCSAVTAALDREKADWEEENEGEYEEE